MAVCHRAVHVHEEYFDLRRALPESGRDFEKRARSLQERRQKTKKIEKGSSRSQINPASNTLSLTVAASPVGV